METKQGLVALGSGLLFAVGLAVSGMTLPRKVIGFLDVLGAWDPSLVFVMVGAIAVHFVAYRLAGRRAQPLFAETWWIPNRKDIDFNLVAGAALFGVGWGLGGYCPGPGVVSLSSGSASALVFVTAMLVGIAITLRAQATQKRTSVVQNRSPDLHRTAASPEG